jgi:hypothetical protein
MGWEAIRESTSWNQANGSTFTSSQEATKLRSTAAVLPPRSLPKNVQLLARIDCPYSQYRLQTLTQNSLDGRPHLL